VGGRRGGQAAFPSTSGCVANNTPLPTYDEKACDIADIGTRNALGRVPTEVIPGTKDIWCRDYMPVQVEEDSFCQFVYRPDYLRGHGHLINPPEACRLPLMRHYSREDIAPDGGNVVASRTRVILTDKVFKENPAIGRTGIVPATRTCWGPIMAKGPAFGGLEGRP
jgi:hypothetical protein